MRTNIVIDDTLVEQGFLLTGLKTKRELVHFALEELVRKRKTQPRLSEAFDVLRGLHADLDLFPDVQRQDRANAFVDE